MEAFINWISSFELSTGHIVSIVIFAIYLLATTIGFAVTFLMGQGYWDLARGLRRILERQEAAGQMEDIEELAGEINKYYDSYLKYNPSISQRYASVINWMEDILLQTNMFNSSKHKKAKRYGVWFDEYYDTLNLVQQHFESRYPFYRCTSSQAQILEDISGLKTDENAPVVENIVKKAEDEFVRLSQEGKKNERSNYISIAIGVAGILVSVLLTVLQMVG